MRDASTTSSVHLGSASRPPLKSRQGGRVPCRTASYLGHCTKHPRFEWSPPTPALLRNSIHIYSQTKSLHTSRLGARAAPKDVRTFVATIPYVGRWSKEHSKSLSRPWRMHGQALRPHTGTISMIPLRRRYPFQHSGAGLTIVLPILEFYRSSPASCAVSSATISRTLLFSHLQASRQRVGCWRISTRAASTKSDTSELSCPTLTMLEHDDSKMLHARVIIQAFRARVACGTSTRPEARAFIVTLFGV